MRMTRSWLIIGTAALAIAVSGCNGTKDDGGNATAADGNAAGAEGKTIAASLDANSTFVQAAKAAGLDATLAGPGPYTVLVPSDDAFAKLPNGMADSLMKPESKAELTRVLTYHILPGTILVDDIGKAIDKGDGTTVLATMGGDTLIATKDGGNIVLTDSSGGKATLSGGDERASNGVVHHVDAVLVPKKAA
jgi:uncharacterized surface protein with fasciclin (FAS1) repeats